MARVNSSAMAFELANEFIEGKPLTNRLVVEGYSTFEWLDGSFWLWLSGFVAAMWQAWVAIVEGCCHTILLHVSTAP